MREGLAADDAELGRRRERRLGDVEDLVLDHRERERKVLLPDTLDIGRHGVELEVQRRRVFDTQLDLLIERLGLVLGRLEDDGAGRVDPFPFFERLQPFVEWA
jgi:hypothetical protein